MLECISVVATDFMDIMEGGEGRGVIQWKHSSKYILFSKINSHTALNQHKGE